ncbi:hypothetical protein HispidOSU_012718, partial [Sigmodon hispidus]
QHYQHAEPLHSHLCSHHSWAGGHRTPWGTFTCEPGSHGPGGDGHGCAHNACLCTDDLPPLEEK